MFFTLQVNRELLRVLASHVTDAALEGFGEPEQLVVHVRQLRLVDGTRLSFQLKFQVTYIVFLQLEFNLREKIAI